MLTLQEHFDQLRASGRENIQKFIGFTGAHPNTVAGWLFGTAKPPTGEWWVRSVCFFLLNNREVVDLTTVDPVAVELAQVLAYNVMSAKEIRDYVGWAEEQALLGFLYGNRTPFRDKRERIEELVAARREDVHQKADELREEFGLEDQAPLPGNSVSLEGDDWAVLARLLNAALPLARRLNGDDGPRGAELRGLMRQAVGAQSYADVALLLRVMTSETTRTAVQKGERR